MTCVYFDHGMVAAVCPAASCCMKYPVRHCAAAGSARASRQNDKGQREAVTLALAAALAGAHLRHLLGPRAALGCLSEAAQTAAVHEQAVDSHDDWVYGHHPVRAGGRLCAALPDRGEGAGALDVAIGGMAAGARIRPVNGFSAAGLCAFPGAWIGQI